MEDRLNVAAQTGDVNTLYALLILDPLLLESIDQFPISQTPLHVAVLSGQTSFLIEIINLKPSLARKLNTDGYSPIHIASIEGRVEMVRELLEFDQDLGLIRGREWRTPLHCAVINGKWEVVNELLSICNSDLLKALTVRKETVLHLALKYGQMEVFDILLEGVKSMEAEVILNWQDREGNTILHLAAYSERFEIIYLLLKTDGSFRVVDKDMKNRSGLTAMDVLKQHTVNESNKKEMAYILKRLGAGQTQSKVLYLADSHHPRRTSFNVAMDPLIILDELWQGFPMEKWAKQIDSSSRETRNLLMVVAILIATVTFQGAVSPPGGFKESYGEVYSVLSNGYPAFLVVLSILNSVGFMASIAMLTVLARGFPLKALLRMAVLSVVATYICFMTYFIFDDPVVVTLVALVMLTILLLQWFRLLKGSMKEVVYV